MIERADIRNPVDLLAEEFLDRRRHGDVVSVDEYALAHPELAAEIRRLFPAMMAMEQFKVCKLSSSGTNVQFRFDQPEQLGDFRIVGELGRGGMGVVYEAEQQSLGRRVALKVFPRQVLRESSHLERFHQEARTAAALHHTNIVPIFGVGEQDGLHYYVMQRIEGRSLEKVIRADLLAGGASQVSQHATNTSPLAAVSTDLSQLDVLGIRNRAQHSSESSDACELSADTIPAPVVREYHQFGSGSRWRDVAKVGVQVAEALAYAHVHGVLHRDIKPSNLLLDPEGTIWVADFGLATVLEAEEKVSSGDVAGTLRFMAPEHLGGQQDARSDIYSLGATLYELLTLRPAFDESNRSTTVQKILQGDVTRPRRICRDIPRDLEAIILKAIAVNPDQRYDSAAVLATDLQRFLDNRPVLARRIGATGRVMRWARRNPAVSTLSATLLMLAVCSFVMISTKWQEAVVEGARAEDNLSLALESMDQILERFGSSWMAHPFQADEESEATSVELQIAVSDHSASVLQNALKFYDRFAEQNATNPQLLRDTAKVHRRVADIYERLGQYSKAEEAYARSLSILESTETPEDNVPILDRAKIRNQLGLTMVATSRFDEAVQQYRSAENILSEDAIRNEPNCQAELARTKHNLGQALWLMGRRDEARDCQQRAVRLSEALVQEYPGQADYRLALARAYRVQYSFVVFCKHSRNQKEIRARGIEILEQLVSDFPAVPDYQCELSEMLATTSCRPRSSESREEQIGQLERAIDISRSLTKAHPSIPRYRAVLARTLQGLGDAFDRGRREDGDQFYAEAVMLYRSIVEDLPDVPAYRLFLASALYDLGENCRQLGRFSRAKAAIEEGLTEQQEYVAMRPGNPFGERMLHRLRDELTTIQSKIAK